jgi:cytochrome c553
MAAPPLIEELRQAGGDPSRVLHPSTAGELAQLQPGARYKFAVLADGRLAVAPDPADAPKNKYSHPTLTNGEAVQTAGGIRIEQERGAIRKVIVDPGSSSYCPSTGSLQAALDALVRIGVDASLLRVDNRPPVCVDAVSSPAPSMTPPMPPPSTGSRYGALMQEVGHRFEVLGKAEKVGRYELADFELDELGEIFEEDLPNAEPPKENEGKVDLKGLADAFQKTHPPELAAALKKRDAAAFAVAFARAAATCNGCHRASGHGYVEVPAEPGANVPKLDRVPPGHGGP